MRLQLSPRMCNFSSSCYCIIVSTLCLPGDFRHTDQFFKASNAFPTVASFQHIALLNGGRWVLAGVVGEKCGAHAPPHEAVLFLGTTSPGQDLARPANAAR